jgi:hypothetical protein
MAIRGKAADIVKSRTMFYPPLTELQGNPIDSHGTAASSQASWDACWCRPSMAGIENHCPGQRQLTGDS